MSLIRQFSLEPGPQLDAFARLRVSEPFTVFDSKLLSDKGDLYWEEETNGTATSVHSTTDAAVTMSVSSSGDRVIRQTYMRFNYQPGKSQMVLITGILGDPVASTEARIGYFNSSTVSPYTADRDGIYFGTDGSDVYLAVSKTGTETKVIQSAWDDPMDGTGPSGITADWTGTQIFGVDFEWLGVGTIRYYLVVDGVPRLIHTINNANTGQSGAYMSSPNHSVRYEVRSTGGANTIKQVCCTVMSEGGVEPSGLSRGVDTGITTQNINAASLEAMIGYRLKSTHLNATIITKFLSLIPTGNEDTQWQLQLNPTYADTPTWNSAGTSSPAEFAVGSGANTISVDGTILAAGYTSDDTNNLGEVAETIIHPGVALDGTRDEIWLCARPQSGGGNYLASINLRELNIG